MPTSAEIDVALEVSWGATSPNGPYYFGLIDKTNYTGIDKTSDTMASHTGWQEFTSYSETARQAFVQGAVSANSLTNPAPADFTPTADGNIIGYFITTSSTKGGTSGRLVDMVIYDNVQLAITGKVFEVQHTFFGKDLVS